MKGDGGFVIWWPQHGCRILCEGPVADFPSWLARGEMGVARTMAAGSAGLIDTPILSSGVDTPILPCSPAVSRFERNYAFSALRNAAGELWTCREGKRNCKLNALSYKMGRLMARGWITLEQVEKFLLLACEKNGLLEDDGRAQCRATLKSGLEAGAMRPYHDIKCED